jgi:hypothetical protein
MVDPFTAIIPVYTNSVSCLDDRGSIPCRGVHTGSGSHPAFDTGNSFHDQRRSYDIQ